MRFAIGVFLASFAAAIPTSAVIIHVPGNYSTIQAGVNAANNGDTVLVAPGTYIETVTIQNAAIHLLSSGGADVTTISRSGSGAYSCLVVSTSSEISGFKISRGSGYYTDPAVQVPGGSPFFHHNLIISFSEGPTCVRISGFESPLFLNNTLYAWDDIADFQYGFHITNPMANPSIKNNIVVCQGAGFGPEYTIYNQAGAIFIHTYNDFWTPTGSGLQGVSLELGEIVADPQWVGGGSYHLQATSPCIDAGSPASPPDPDFTRADMGAFYFPQMGSPTLNITLTPIQPSIQIPASGGSFIYIITAENTGTMALFTQVWCDVILPNGSLYGPVLGPVTINLSAGAILSRQRIQNVPGVAPAGDYLYQAKSGIYPSTLLDQDSFPFTKLAMGGRDAIADWMNSGEPFDENVTVKTAGIPDQFSLLQIYPNPFNPVTTIAFTLPQTALVRLAVFDMQGRLVKEILRETRDPDLYSVTWDAGDLASGLYFCRIQAGNFTDVKKLLLLK